jgi:hypothetical protein
MLEEKEDDFYISPKLKDWGKIIRQRAVASAKRLNLLYCIKDLIRKFKNFFGKENLK